MTFHDGRGSRDEGANPQPGERTGGATYRELLPIGSGGSANITIAVAEGIAGFSKLVVLKTIREELTSNSAATKMFLDEARLSARMNHPNVVQVYEVFLRRDVPVIVMEFLDGQPLNSILAQAPDSKSLTVELVMYPAGIGAEGGGGEDLESFGEVRLDIVYADEEFDPCYDDNYDECDADHGYEEAPEAPEPSEG